MSKIIANKKYKTLILLVAVLVILVIGSTYAWLQINVKSDKRQNLHAGTLSLKLSDETTNGISLTNAYPMTEQEGLNTTVYTFTLVNDGTIDSNYEIYLDDLELSEAQTQMDTNIIKYRFQKGEEQSTTGVLSSLGESPNRILDSGIIEKKESINYQLQVWMDYEADNSQQGTTFKSQLRIEASQR